MSDYAAAGSCSAGAGSVKVLLVDWRGEKPWVAVSVHQCVDLSLSVIERLWTGAYHVLVDNVSDFSIQAHLNGGRWESVSAMSHGTSDQS